MQHRIKAQWRQLPDSGKGVALALCSTLGFVLVGVLVRMLSERFEPFQILFFRQLVFVAVLLPAISRNLAELLKPKRVSMHLARIVGAFVAFYFSFISVSNLPLADATALGFTQVLFVAVIAKLWLSEDLSRSRLFSLGFGFLGVMMVVQPNFSAGELHFIGAGLLAAMGAAVAVIVVRALAQSQSKLMLLTYQAVAVGLIALVPSLHQWQWPTPPELTLLLLVGGISSVAQWLGVSAYQWAAANVVANVEYVKILYALALGILLFAERPNLLAVAGAAVLIASAVIPLWLSHQRRQQ
ncbi:DMT family transporter [uncultured Ferrimonas sp.]|uniref:DMT family transporter n=1 Tax=uncultured Ferrimonas sp. TaxID=432640 RepID=UPI0026220CF4|nr:DMT family transporter [uncultured Ferrimonas sp.]